MGKITWEGPVSPDDPMFSNGPEFFSRPESKPSTKNTPPNPAEVTAGESPISPSPKDRSQIENSIATKERLSALESESRGLDPSESEKDSWHLLYQGTGSLSGNDWFEQVRYLGDERWLLSIEDDPAWLVEDSADAIEEAYSSNDLVDLLVNMDTADSEDGLERQQALLRIAIEVRATACIDLLRKQLNEV